MNEPKLVSIILPTRGRANQFDECLNQLIDCTADMSRIELCLKVDADDTPTLRLVEDLLDIWRDGEIQVKTLILQRHPEGYGRLYEYYNLLGAIASGDWLFHYSDDAFMKTDGWDTKLHELLEDGLHDIVCLQPTMNGDPNCFPIISRKWFEITGHFSLHISLEGWVERVAKELGVMKPIGIDILHEKHELTGIPKDQTRIERDAFLNDWNRDFVLNHVDNEKFTALWRKDIKVLQAYIDEDNEKLSLS